MELVPNPLTQFAGQAENILKFLVGNPTVRMKQLQ